MGYIKKNFNEWGKFILGHVFLEGSQFIGRGDLGENTRLITSYFQPIDDCN